MLKPLLRVAVLLAVACPLLLFAPDAHAADGNWPRWRGPLQDGHSPESGFPKKWSADDVLWKTKLPGIGQSSPIVWGNRVFLTAALEQGRERIVLCVDRTTGRILWKTSVWKGDPEPIHRMNSWATASCVTDGDRVYAFFGKGGGLFCLSVDGEILWNRPLGDFPGPWGTAACPVLVDHLVIQNCDSDGDAFLIACHKETGEVIWKADREDFRGWSTPVLIEAAGRRELVLQGHTGVRAYDPQTGRELWYVTGSNGRGTPTVTPANGLLYVIPGRPGTTYALKPGGNGDVTKSHRVWSVNRKGRDLPSPIIVGDYMLAVGLNGGIMTCYDAKTGKQLWQERIGGNFSASPISYDGVAVFLSEAGEAIVIEPADTPKIIARNTIDPDDEEIFRATITPVRGQLLIRSTTTLYCIGK